MSLPAKYAPVVGSALMAGLAAHSEIVAQVAAVLAGLTMGAMWRAGSLRSEGALWLAVRSDLAISGLIGGANAVLALALADWLNLSVLLTMALAVVVGATGLRALPEIKDALATVLRRKLLGDDVALIQPRNEEIADQVRRLREKAKSG